MQDWFPCYLGENKIFQTKQGATECRIIENQGQFIARQLQEYPGGGRMHPSLCHENGRYVYLIGGKADE